MELGRTFQKINFELNKELQKIHTKKDMIQPKSSSNCTNTISKIVDKKIDIVGKLDYYDSSCKKETLFNLNLKF